MIADKACYERGCPCYDPREGEGVEVVEKREWVGLTDEYLDELMMNYGYDADDESMREMLRDMESKLRQENT